MEKVSKIAKIKSTKIKIEPVKISVSETQIGALKVGAKKTPWQMIAWGRILIGSALVIVLFAGLVWLFSGRGLVVDNINAGQLSKKQETLLLEKISKHIKLPTSQYQIAVAVEPDKLKALSPFYNQIEVNNIVVVYEHFALIYDERVDVLVNATMLNQQ